MPLLDIRIYGDPILSQAAQPIEKIEPRHRELARDMAETMYHNHGIGLAANQIGELERIIVVDVHWARAEKEEERPPKNPVAMINPEIIEESVEDAPYEEGCLSIPKITAEVWRPKSIKLRYRALDGNIIERACAGLLARCVQHEIDHINGVLFVDRLGKLKRATLSRALGQLARSRTAPAQKA